MTPREIIATARHILMDSDAAQRQSDDELLIYVNEGLCECSTLAPQLFYTTGELECTPESTEQGVSFADAQLLVDVVRVRGGRAILPCDMSALASFNPNWGEDVSAPAIHWFKHDLDPLRFYLYPKAPEGQVIEVKYVRNPAKVGIDDEITDLPQSMRPSLVNYVIARAESKDDEHVLSQRAAAAYQQFVSALKPA